MNYEKFKQMNLGWDDGVCRYHPEHGERYMRKNYEIMRDVKRKFYSHYDRHSPVPQNGDVIDFVNYNSRYPNAVVEYVDRFGVISICESGSTFTDGDYCSVSGGAFKRLHESHFEFAGYAYRRFWTWGTHGSGGNQGIHFYILVRKWRQKNMPELIPDHQIYIGNRHYLNRGSKVVVKENTNYLFAEFKTIQAFKAWAEYVGLTYRRTDYGDYFAKQFLINQFFWTMDEIPAGSKPIELCSNGYAVLGFVHKEGNTITFYRPNPNAKEVYVPAGSEVFSMIK